MLVDNGWLEAVTKVHPDFTRDSKFFDYSEHIFICGETARPTKNPLLSLIQYVVHILT